MNNSGLRVTDGRPKLAFSGSLCIRATDFGRPNFRGLEFRQKPFIFSQSDGYRLTMYKCLIIQSIDHKKSRILTQIVVL